MLSKEELIKLGNELKDNNTFIRITYIPDDQIAYYEKNPDQIVHRPSFLTIRYLSNTYLYDRENSENTSAISLTVDNRSGRNGPKDFPIRNFISFTLSCDTLKWYKCEFTRAGIVQDAVSDDDRYLGYTLEVIDLATSDDKHYKIISRQKGQQ